MYNENERLGKMSKRLCRPIIKKYQHFVTLKFRCTSWENTGINFLCPVSTCEGNLQTKKFTPNSEKYFNRIEFLGRKKTKKGEKNENGTVKTKS